MKNKYFHTLVALFCIFIAAAEPIAKKGVLDLRHHNFDEQATIELAGEWEFYWEKLYSTENLEQPEIYSKADFIDYLTRWGDLPQLQNSTHQFGFATMRLQILCPENLPPMSIYLPEVFSAYDMYVNGEGFEGNGQVGKNKEESVHYWRPSVKSIVLKPGKNVILVHISNFGHHKGGMIDHMILGESDEINYARNFRTGSTLFLAGCLLIAGAIGFTFFWFKTSDYTGIFFFLFACSYMYRILGTEEYVIHAVNRNLPWSFTLRLEYISLYCSVAFFIYFMRNLIEPKVKIIVLHIAAGISLILALLSSFLPTEIFTSFIDLYLVFLGVMMVTVGLIYIAKINLRHKTSFVTLAGGGFLAMVAFVKILSHFNIVGDNQLIATIGYVGFIFCQALAMTIRFGRSYRESTLAAQVAAQSKDQFLNTMSHELRTPMSAILGMADLLQNSRLDKDQKEKIDTIKTSGESLLSIIKDILNFTEAGTGKMVLENDRMSIKECLKGAYDIMNSEKKEAVEFTTYLDPKIPEFVLGDSIRLKQILIHLLSNAFKFTNEGRVELKARLEEKKSNSTVVGFEVSDTGIGMQKKTVGEIFKVFSQEQSANNRKFGGVGLGLAVVKKVVELMKGEIQVSSIPGNGTKIEFTIEFENDKAVPKEKQEANEENILNPKLKVLYAEDNPINQKLISMMMKGFGLDIDIAVNGLEAWEMAKAKHYHVVLMDIQMPEMDGIESTKRIIQDVKERPIIIAVTANATISDKKRCFEAGMNDFLTKPIKADVLKDGILKWQNFRDNKDENGQPKPKYIQLSS